MSSYQQETSSRSENVEWSRKSHDRAHSADFNLAKMVSDTERLMRHPAAPSFLTVFHPRGQKVQERTNILDDCIRSEDKGPRSIPEHETTPAPESLFCYSNHSQLCPQIKEIAQEKSRHIFVFETEKSFLEAAEDASSDVFWIGSESANDKLKNISFLFVKSILSDSELEGVLDNMLDRNIEEWTQPSFYNDMFPR